MCRVNVDPQEIAKFDALASEWWNPAGPVRALHWINPVRLAYVQQHIALEGKRILDVGCGGGILTESLAKVGTQVTGIDLSESLLRVARDHAAEKGYRIDYQAIDLETLAKQQPQSFDVLTCMEMLEHVPDPAHIVQACATLLKPGGLAFFSTLNRHPKSFLFAIVGAEYIFNFLPKGTHAYADFIRPSELDQWARSSSLHLQSIRGISYRLSSQRFVISDDVKINYLTCYAKY